jgi:hypothetical protein
VIATSQALAEEFAVNKMKQWEAAAATSTAVSSSRPWLQQQQQESVISRRADARQRALGAAATSLVAGVGSGSSGGAIAARVLDSHHDMLLASGLHQSYSHPSEHHELAQADADRQQQAADEAAATAAAAAVSQQAGISHFNRGADGFGDVAPHRIITMEGSHQALQGMALHGLDSCDDDSSQGAAAAAGGVTSGPSHSSSSSRRLRRGGIVSMASMELSEEDWDEADLQVRGRTAVAFLLCVMLACVWVAIGSQHWQPCSIDVLPCADSSSCCAQPCVRLLACCAFCHRNAAK